MFPAVAAETCLELFGDPKTARRFAEDRHARALVDIAPSAAMQ
jgi:hypothetical protein